MSAVAATSDDVLSLPFARSESKAVGVHGGWMDKIRDNSPRIVGGLKLLGDVTAGLTGDWFLIGYAVFATLARLIVISYGTKANQKQVAKEHQKQEGETPPGTLGKVFKPREYPIESSAGIATFAEAMGLGYGISELAKGNSGYTPLLLGVIGIGSYANILFGKEKKKEAAEKSEPLVFARSESKPVGWFGKAWQTIKDNPVMTSSLVQLGMSISMLIGGLIEGHHFMYVAAAALFIVANGVQTLFVRKNEFNIEGARQEQAERETLRDHLTPPAANHADSITRRRQEAPGCYSCAAIL